MKDEYGTLKELRPLCFAASMFHADASCVCQQASSVHLLIRKSFCGIFQYFVSNPLFELPILLE